MSNCHVIVKGYVQGVGYRQFVRKEAEKRGITGWVQNLSDGAVEAFFQGEKPEVEALIALCRQGPIVANVENVFVEWVDDMDAYPSFEVLK